MPSKASNETIAKRYVNAKKELDGYAARKTKAEEFIANYDSTVAELTAEVEHYGRLAEGRGLSAEQISELGAPSKRTAAEFREPVVPEGEAVTSGV